MNGADSWFWTEDPLPYVERTPRMIYIGVDPGVSGGIACIDDHGVVKSVHKMPETGADVLALLHDLALAAPSAVRAVLEKVNPGVFGHGAGDRKMGVVSAFTFGRSVERVNMALLAAGIPFDEVLPVKWQTAMSCRTRGDKNISKARAQQLFPGVKVTHAIADALLIAEYCRRADRPSIYNSPEGEQHGEEVEEAGAEKGNEAGTAKQGEVGEARRKTKRRRRAEAPA